MDAAQIHTLLAPLGLWIGRVLACAALLAVEGPVLLFVAWVKVRPWYERALAALPLAACVWAVVVLRSLQSAYDDWQSYLTFQASHYPAEFGKSVASWVGPEIAAAAQQGVSVAWVTGILLVAGWAALAWWLLSAAQHRSRTASRVRLRARKKRCARSRCSTKSGSIVGESPQTSVRLSRTPALQCRDGKLQQPL